MKKHFILAVALLLLIFSCAGTIAWRMIPAGPTPFLISATIPSTGATLVLVFNVAVYYDEADSVALAVTGLSSIVGTTPISGNGTNTLTYTIKNNSTGDPVTILTGVSVFIPSIGGNAAAFENASNVSYYLAARSNMTVTNNSVQ